MFRDHIFFAHFLCSPFSVFPSSFRFHLGPNRTSFMRLYRKIATVFAFLRFFFLNAVVAGIVSSFRCQRVGVVVFHCFLRVIFSFTHSLCIIIAQICITISFHSVFGVEKQQSLHRKSHSILSKFIEAIA